MVKEKWKLGPFEFCFVLLDLFRWSIASRADVLWQQSRIPQGRRRRMLPGLDGAGNLFQLERHSVTRANPQFQHQWNVLSRREHVCSFKVSWKNSIFYSMVVHSVSFIPKIFFSFFILHCMLFCTMCRFFHPVFIFWSILSINFRNCPVFLLFFASSHQDCVDCLIGLCRFFPFSIYPGVFCQRKLRSAVLWIMLMFLAAVSCSAEITAAWNTDHLLAFPPSSSPSRRMRRSVSSHASTLAKFIALYWPVRAWCKPTRRLCRHRSTPPASSSPTLSCRFARNWLRTSTNWWILDIPSIDWLIDWLSSYFS